MGSQPNNTTNLSAALTQLVLLCQNRFQILLSAQSLLDDAAYRATVLAELAQLDDAQLQAALSQVRQAVLQSDVPAASAQAVAAATDDSADKVAPKKLWPLAAALSLAVLAGAWWFLTAENPSGVQAAASDVVTTPGSDTAQAATVAAVPATEPAATAAKPASTVLRLHGSNTIGEKLAPALLEAFFAKQGAEQFAWQKQHSDVERLLRFNAESGAQQVELHAHGSGTAFKALLSAQADVGMSSRRVSEKEVNAARTELGDLSKIGNEHIIALDGLAIIVNQNNSLKAISTETLAKVFSGELSNWSQLGGADKAIQLLARDDNSGTFDTFNSLVLKKFGKTLSNKAQRFESSTDLSVAVSQDEAAIGFIGLNYISYNKALAISEGADTTPIYPTRFTVSTEDYALSRRLYLYTPTAASQLAKDFAQFAISEQGQQLVEQTGLISQNIRIEQVFPMDAAPPSYNQYAQTGQRLSLNFRFNYGENDLDNKGKRDLQRLIRFMEQNSGRRLVLMGFSDSVGAVVKNADLAMRRAKAVERELVSRGIPVMAVESYGELLPVANNDTEAGRERNRRVEVWVI